MSLRAAVNCLVLTVLGSLSFLNAQDLKPPGDRNKDLSHELAVDLGGGLKLEMGLLPAGEFMMGSPASDTDAFSDERPQHRVRITKPYYLGKYAVTREQWKAVMGNSPRYSRGPQHPVNQVNWDDCQKFLDKLNASPHGVKGKFQLPTEAQWEYACRAGSQAKYCFGDDEAQLGTYAWYAANSDGRTHDVGGKRPNAWGLYDMHGNVWEWCVDWYDGRYYATSPVDDPSGPATGTDRVGRGGGRSAIARLCRSTVRYGFKPGFKDFNLGLRVCLAPRE